MSPNKSNPTNATSKSKFLHISLWVAQVILGFMFAFNGVMKATQPIEQLSAMFPWTTQVPVGLVRFIGAVELLGALGLILPSLLRIKPLLTPWAATGLATIMIFALGFHISKGEYFMIPMNLSLALVCSLIAWGRFKKAPITSKS